MKKMIGLKDDQAKTIQSNHVREDIEVFLESHINPNNLYNHEMYEILNDLSYSTYPWKKEDIGEGMSLIYKDIWDYWKPRFLLNNNTKCAYEFMNSEEFSVIVTKDDINWESLEGLCEKAMEVAKSCSFHYPSFIKDFKNGVAEVSWELNPDGMYFMDDDGFGMTNDKEIKIYGFIDKKGKVLVKFQVIKNDDDLKTMRSMAEKIIVESYKITIMNDIFLVRCGQGNSIKECVYSDKDQSEFTWYEKKCSQQIGKQLSNEQIGLVLHGNSNKNSDLADILVMENHGNLQSIYHPVLKEVELYFDKLHLDYSKSCKVIDDEIILEYVKNKVKEFLESINTYSPSDMLLIVSNGLFCKCLESIISEKPISSIVWMECTEYRRLSRGAIV